MTIVCVQRTHYLEDCIVEGYKGYFSQWEIRVEAPVDHKILEFCQKFCSEREFTKQQFINDLNFILKECNGRCRKPFNIKSFYELKHNSDKSIWTYTVKSILQDFV